MMQHKPGSIDGDAIVIRDYANLKQDKARAESRIRISHLSMASKRITEDYPDLAAWFCLRVMTGREFAVEKALIEEGVEAIVPATMASRVVRRGRVREVAPRPVMPCYVLVRCVPSAGAFVGLRRFDKVLDIVGGAERPYRIPDKFVNRFIALAKEGAYEHREPAAITFMVNEVVRICDGPFASFPATVVSIDIERSRVNVEASIFGRSTPIDLDIAQIEKV